MAGWLDRGLARLASWHAARVTRGFERTLHDVRGAQQSALRRALVEVRGSDFANRFGIDRVQTLAELRRAVPLQSYEDLHPWIERLYAGEDGALLRPGSRPIMFATSSGTTAQRKLIPVTPAFVRDYRRGWNIFGLKMLSDHPRAILRSILQSSGRWDESRSPAGVPVGAITGLLARTQKRIVRRYYVGSPRLAEIRSHAARCYTLMRLALTRDVAFAVTANPATLVRLAQVADENSAAIIRDVRDGTLDEALVPRALTPAGLRDGMRPDPGRARELEQIHAATGGLRPCDVWKLDFVACWTGGSMSHYLERVASWWGPVPVRDVGLLASEGRVTIPLTDNTPVGVLDVSAACFEFIPLAALERGDAQPETLAPHELIVGERYGVVLTNTAALLRYRLDDVVRVHGFEGEAPLLEFLHRAGRVASVAGEKVTENQVVAAWRSVAGKRGLEGVEFAIAPVFADPPYYRVIASVELPTALLAEFDAALAEQNEEYASRRTSARLGTPTAVLRPAQVFQQLEQREIERRGGTSEQYKRTVLLVNPGDDRELLAGTIPGNL